MKLVTALTLSAAGLVLPSASLAQPGPYNDPAPGSASILSSDYANAEREIRSADVSPYDPARSINLGIIFAKTGRADKAAREFRQVLNEEDVQIVVANGKTYSSHDVASRALAALQSGALKQ
jgi:Flp pilus assembly protein TadD